MSRAIRTTMGFHSQEVDSDRLRATKDRMEARQRAIDYREQETPEDRDLLNRLIGQGLWSGDDDRTSAVDFKPGGVVTTREDPPAEVILPLSLPTEILLEIAKFCTHKKWGTIQIDFADGKPVLVRSTQTTKVKGE